MWLLALLKKWYWDIWFPKKEEVEVTMYLSEEQIAFNKRLAKLRGEEE